MKSLFSLTGRFTEGKDLLFSDAVSTTGILIQRGTGTPQASKTITTSAVGTPGVITTSAPHGMVSGDEVVIATHAGSVPDINGTHIVNVLSPTTFDIGVDITTGGTGGTAIAQDTFEDIGEITSVTPPTFERPKLPTTTHNEGRSTNALGMLEQGDLGGRINYVAGNETHKDILNDILTNTKKNWRCKFPPASGLVMTGPGRVQRFALADAPPNSIQAADLVIAWSGIISIGYAIPVGD